MRELDLALFYAINRWPDELAPFFFHLSEATKWMPTRVLLVGLWLFLILRPQTRWGGVGLVLAFPLANELTDQLKAFFAGLRPCYELPDVILRQNFMSSFGTASAHSANMAAVAVVMTWYYGPKWGSLWIAIAALTGLSRIYLGAHYPYQVLFGWFCGVAVALLVIAALERLKARFGKASPEARPAA